MKNYSPKIGYPVSFVVVFTLLLGHCPIKHWCIWSFHLQRINKMKGIQYGYTYIFPFYLLRMEIILFTSTITFLDLIQIWIRNTCLSRRLNKHKSVVYVFYQFKLQNDNKLLLLINFKFKIRIEMSFNR